MKPRSLGTTALFATALLASSIASAEPDSEGALPAPPPPPPGYSPAPAYAPPAYAPPAPYAYPPLEDEEHEDADEDEDPPSETKAYVKMGFGIPLVLLGTGACIASAAVGYSADYEGLSMVVWAPLLIGGLAGC